jgi:hypothetical protein
MAFDTAGHIYISDPNRARWADLDLATGRVRYYGTRGTGDGGFTAPTGIAIGPGGLIYVLDRSNGVQVFAPGTSK